MRYTAMILALLLAACSGATGPAPITPPPPGLDPIVLGVNHAVNPMFVAWYSQSGLSRVDTFPGQSTRCTAFTSASLVDSVRFVAWVGDTLGQGWQRDLSPWFDPRLGLTSDSALNKLSYPHGAEFWTMSADPTTLGGFATTFKLAADSLAPC
jgi:hypothetical protein